MWLPASCESILRILARMEFLFNKANTSNVSSEKHEKGVG